MPPAAPPVDGTVARFEMPEIPPDHPLLRWWLIWLGAGLLLDAVLVVVFIRRRGKPVPLRAPGLSWPLHETAAVVCVMIVLSLAAALCAWAVSGEGPGEAGAREAVGLLCNAVILQGVGTFFVLSRLRTYGVSPRAAFGLRPNVPASAPVVAFAALLAVSPPIDFVQFVFPSLMERLGWDMPLQELPLRFLETPSPWTLAMIAVLAVVIVPIFEELLFRGVLYRSLRPRIGPLAAAGLSAAVFAVSHGTLSVLPGFFILGLALVCVYELTGSLAAPILVHAGFNAKNVLMMMVLRDLGGAG